MNEDAESVAKLREHCLELRDKLSLIEDQQATESDSAELLSERHERLFIELGEVQRKLAEAEGRSFVRPLEHIPAPHTSVPSPFLCGRSRAFLLYRLKKSWRGEDQKKLEEINIGNSSDSFLAVMFANSIHIRLGFPGRDCIEESEFWDAGLKGLEFVEVLNSPLMARLIEMEKRAEEYNPHTWKEVKHILLYFHDESFECLCRDWSLLLIHGSRKEAIRFMMNRFYGNSE